MSRQPTDEEIFNLGNQFMKGVDNLTAVDTSRLRMPFSGVCKTPRKQSWMTVSVPVEMESYQDDSSESVSCAHTKSGHSLNCNPNFSRESSMQDVVVDICRKSNIKLSLEPLMHQNSSQTERQLALLKIQEKQSSCLDYTRNNSSGRQLLDQRHGCKIKGWMLSVGYSIFGLVLALCNLLSSAYTNRVCTAMSPIPMVCLLLQALFCMDNGVGQKNTFFHEAWCLIITATLLPTACVLWNLYVSIPLILFLSFSVVSCLRQRGLLVWGCVLGVCLSLIVATPISAVNSIEPKWSMTVAMFFLGVLCFLLSISSGGLNCSYLKDQT